MFNHLVDSFDELSDSEVEDKIIELGRKYWMSRNPDVQAQIYVVLEMFKQEAVVRRAQSIQKSQSDDDNGLDKLINVS